MLSTEVPTFDFTGAASSMYDGIGRPFIFGCRTNGALVWDQVRALYGLVKDDYQSAEQALEDTPPGRWLVFWQPRLESFPVSGSFPLQRWDNAPPELGVDYSGCIESSLAAVYYHSRPFSQETTRPLFVTGGAAESPGILRRIAAIWQRPVISIEKSGASLGAAIAGAVALYQSENKPFELESFTRGIVKQGKPVLPAGQDIAAYHQPGGYLDRFTRAEKVLINL